MYEITIRNLETNEIVDTLQSEMVLAVAYNKTEGKMDYVCLRGDIENLGYTMMHNGKVRAACRLAIARWEGKNDIEEEENRKAKKLLGETLGNFGEKLGADVKAADLSSLAGAE